MKLFEELKMLLGGWLLLWPVASFLPVPPMRMSAKQELLVYHCSPLHAYNGTWHIVAAQEIQVKSMTIKKVCPDKGNSLSSVIFVKGPTVKVLAVSNLELGSLAGHPMAFPLLPYSIHPVQASLNPSITIQPHTYPRRGASWSSPWCRVSLIRRGNLFYGLEIFSKQNVWEERRGGVRIAQCHQSKTALFAELPLDEDSMANP